MDKGDPVKKIPFLLVTGFLGSGKTTLLLDLVRKYSSHLRMAIVQNEFAPGHVDGNTLRQSGKSFKILEINNGSVFCACLLSDFIEKLDPFIEEAKPDVILLEATGLANPVSLGQIIHSEKLSEKIFLAASWCMVDASNFSRVIDAIASARHQVRMADHVWINKTDLVRNTSEIRKKIESINPFARVSETAYASTHEVDFNKLLRPDNQNLTPYTRKPISDKLYPNPEPLNKITRPETGSCVIRTNRFYDLKRVEEFISNESGKLYRMKGYIRISPDETFAVQTVFNDIKVSMIRNYDGPTEIIILGPGLNCREFSKKFQPLQIK